MKPAKLVLLADTLFSLYEQMLRIRRCEERLVKSFHEGLIPGAFHSSLGQEAVAVGVCHHLRADDAVFSTHRGQGHALAKGLAMLPLMAELYGRAHGWCGGRAGPTCWCLPEQSLFGTNSLSGNSALEAVGAACAFQMLEVERVAVAFLGDGGAMSGAYYEGVQLAAHWQLPIVFVCERNQFAGRHAVGKAGGGVPGAASKFFDIPGFEVDGNDVAMVYAAAFEGVRRAREGKGPMIVDCSTFRQRPFAENDLPASQISPIPERPHEQDPLTMLADRLQQQNAIDAAELAELDTRVRAEVEQAHREAAASPWPGAPQAEDKGAGHA